VPFRQRRSITVHQLVRALVNFDTLPSRCLLALVVLRLKRPNPLWFWQFGATRCSFLTRFEKRQNRKHGTELSVFNHFRDLLRGFLRENLGAKMNETILNVTKKEMRQYE
jgi:hypothetical protein